MSERSYRIGLLGVAALVVLRIGVGWHFFYEGMWKYKHPEFSSSGYFMASKGPFADKFRELVPDPYGEERLSIAWTKNGASYLETRWNTIRDRFFAHYGYDAKTKQEAVSARILRLRVASVKDMLDDPEAIAEYRFELAKLKEVDAAEKLRSAPFQQKRLVDQRTKVLGLAKSWLSEIEKQEQGLIDDYYSLLDGNQQVQPKPDRLIDPTTLDWLDWMTVWTVMLVGFGLMVGLFTRLSAVAGAGFLLLVILAQPAIPNLYPPPHPSAGHSLYINKEVLEFLALLVLATTPVGRWGGLDFFIHRGLTAATSDDN